MALTSKEHKLSGEYANSKQNLSLKVESVASSSSGKPGLRNSIADSKNASGCKTPPDDVGEQLAKDSALLCYSNDPDYEVEY